MYVRDPLDKNRSILQLYQYCSRLSQSRLGKTLLSIDLVRNAHLYISSNLDCGRIDTSKLLLVAYYLFEIVISNRQTN